MSSTMQSIAPRSSAPLRLRPLGRTALQVTELSVGSAPLGELYQRIATAQAVALLDSAADLGVNLFDTSPFYGAGLAEHRVGQALRERPRDSFLLSTKVGRWFERPGSKPHESSGWAGGLQFNANLDYSYDGAMRSYEQSLLRLGMPRVDLLLIHDVDVFTHGTQHACNRRFDEAMNGAYRALCELRRCGDIKAIGVGVNEAEMCSRFAEAGDFDCMLLAGRYSLLEQGAVEQFLPLAKKKNIGVLLGGVFNSGVLASGAREGAKYNYASAPPKVLQRVAQLEEVCKSHRVPLAAAALQFPLAHPSVSSVLVGASSPGEIAQNSEWLRLPLPGGLWSDLRGEGLVHPDAPTPGG